MTGEQKEESTRPAWLQTVLSEFDEVFQEPQGLPSSSRHDHAIVLERANIPNTV